MVKRVGAIIEKTVVIPMSSKYQEMEKMGLKMERLTELKMRKKPFKNGSLGGSERTNLTGVKVDTEQGD